MSAAFHITFFGTQPTLTQVPPSAPDSTIATLAPYSAARCAAARPPLPPPITTKSNSSAINLLERLSEARHGTWERLPHSQSPLRSSRCVQVRAVQWSTPGDEIPMENPLLGHEPLP